MKVCPNCGKTYDDNVAFCVSCGSQLDNANGSQASFQNNQYYNGQPYNIPVQPIATDPKDHTAEYSQQDISDNKVIAMLPYISGFIGIIIALLAINHSKYVAFHVKQSLKIQVVSVLAILAAALLCWTFIVPAAAGIFQIVLFVVKIICFVHVCQGKAKEAPIVSGFGFLS